MFLFTTDCTDFYQTYFPNDFSDFLRFLRSIYKLPSSCFHSIFQLSASKASQTLNFYNSTTQKTPISPASPCT